MSTVILQNKVDGKDQYYLRSRAIIEVVGALKMPYSFFYYPLKILPCSISDHIYSWIGRNRYRMFGKRSDDKSCCKFE